MAQIVWTEPALIDLNEIAEYIALDKLGAAQDLVEKIFSTVERLQEFPESGRFPPELDVANYREIICGPCRIFYRLENNKVFILYVKRSERELRKFILDDR